MKPFYSIRWLPGSVKFRLSNYLINGVFMRSAVYSFTQK